MSRSNEVDGLKVTQTVAISVRSEGGWIQAACKVLDITDRQIAVTPPPVPDYAWKFPPGTTVQVDYQDAVARYHFSTEVIGFQTDRIETVILRRPERVDRIQRRDHVRLEIMIPARFRLTTEQGGALVAVPGEPADTVTHDISAGGCRLQVSEPVPPGTILEIELSLRDQGVLRLLGRVVRLHEEKRDEEGLPPLRYVGVEWVGVPERERDRIMAFIFQEQVRRRRADLA